MASKSLPWILALLSCPACGAARLCRIAQLTELEGEILGQGGPVNADQAQPVDGCAWHIRPGMWLRAIEFETGGAEFAASDQLSFYASAASRAGLVLRASAASPLPASVVLTGSSEVLVVLSARSPATRVRLTYRCTPAGHRLGSLYLPPAVYVSLLAALAFLGLAACLLPAYALCHCWAKRRRARGQQGGGGAPRPAPRRELQEYSHANYFIAEQRTVVTLEALPTKLWSEVEESGQAEECCFCLDSFKDVEEVRVLPCGHYFHKACVDRWFAARRYMPRSCPHCRRDPAANSPVATPTCAVAATAYGRPAADAAAGARPAVTEDARLLLPGAVPEARLLLPGAVPEGTAP